MKIIRKAIFILCLFLFGLMFVNPVFGGYDENCSCHKTVEPIIDESVYAESKHVSTVYNSCIDCHVGYTSSLPHPKKTVDCDACHPVGFTKDDWDTRKHDVTRSHPTPPPSKQPEEETPGFGIAIATVGLIVVAFLIKK